MIVIDTNVIYSALRSNLGASYLLLDALSEGKVEFAISTALAFEYEDVLKRPDAGLVFSEEEIDEILDSIISLGVRCSPHFLWRPSLKDPKDDMVLELAIVSGAKRIITHNIKDFRDTPSLGVTAITPLEYVRKEKIL
jgi:putative PIN family toxin of toxin-antitoxin system